MRFALALLATLACAQAAAAQTAEDRYGPARPAYRTAGAAPQQVASIAPYSGRMLNWSGKLSPQAMASPPAVEVPAPAVHPVQQPQPVAAYTPAPVAAPLRGPVGAAAPRREVQPQPVATPAPAILDARPASAPRRETAAAPLPDSLYAAPPPAAPAPQRLAAATPTPATPAAAGSQTRLYSVHREYGLAPDAIPAARNGGSAYVLIGPPEGAAGKMAARDDQESRDDDARPF